MKVAIIEDDAIAAHSLIIQIRKFIPSATFLPIITSVEAGISMLRDDKQVDLLIADIELPDGLSFDIIRIVDLTAPIIFCTAYQQYAFRAFDTLAIDYILKPSTEENVKNALNKFSLLTKDARGRNEPIGRAELVWQNPLHVFAKQSGKMFVIQRDDIAVVSSEFGNTYIYTFNGQRHMMNSTLDELEMVLGDHFFRTTRQEIVNRNAIVEVKSSTPRKLEIITSSKYQKQIIVGKLKRTAFKSWLLSTNI